MVAPPDPAAGKHRLALGPPIGRGAFGTVYKGKYDGDTVAIKTANSNDEAFAQFGREARTLKTLEHRNIISFKALCRTGKQTVAGGNWALVLEYAKDGTLFAKVSKQMMSAGGLGGSKVYSNAQALGWALGVAEALEYLHLRTPAIFHRDVKLSNIMLTTGADGKSVAKISDFGLHVVADSTRDREFITGSAVGRANFSFSQPPQQQHSPQRPRPSGRAAAAPGESYDYYSELHVSGGSKSFVGFPPLQQQAQAGADGTSTPPRPHDLSGGNMDSRRNTGAGTVPSFRRASHHPGEDMAASRLCPAAFDEDTGSMCSVATDATWASSGQGSDDGASSIAMESDVETVFDMTGQTGSSLYMAPEVCNGERYNEKADVFSFGVVLYELMARCLIMFTELPTNSTDPAVADRYAQKVAGGYRPAKPKRMPDNIWQLIEACWQQDPIKRPHMSEVVSVLQDLLAADVAAAGLSGRRNSLSLSRFASGQPAGVGTPPQHSPRSAPIAAPPASAGPAAVHSKSAAAPTVTASTASAVDTGAAAGSSSGCCVVM